MKTSEMGVYILGSMALAILAVAGVMHPETNALFYAVLAAGAGYFSQSFCAVVEQYEESGLSSPTWALALNVVSGILSMGLWALGVYSLL